MNIARDEYSEYPDYTREEITMQPFVESLSDQDVADLATFYAGLLPCP
ncbi:MAG: hypothetical protein OXG05_07920 [Gammaproteobacteria bacterium]|nr:hypothetical protein [Gammaproteobacteria bacterium]